jgi:hypothetical protein
MRLRLNEMEKQKEIHGDIPVAVDGAKGNATPVGSQREVGVVAERPVLGSVRIEPHSVQLEVAFRDKDCQVLDVRFVSALPI